MGVNRLGAGISGSQQRHLDLMRGITRTLCSSHTVPHLLRQTCEQLVHHGGYPFAWIGHCDSGDSLRPRAWVGNAKGYLDEAALLRDVPLDARDPAVRAFYHGDVVVEPKLDARDRSAARYGFAAGVGLPLRVESLLHGAIGVYADRRDAFDEATVQLLNEVARTVTYGISRFQLQQELERLHALLETYAPVANRLPVHIGESIMLLDPDEICYARADGHYTRLCGPEQEFFCSQPLKWVADRLPDGRFLRVHRSYVVNLRHVRALTSASRRNWLTFSLPACNPVPVSRGYIIAVRQALGIDMVSATHQ